MSTTNFPANYRLAVQAAMEASAVIMDFYNMGFNSELKVDGSPVTDADLASSKVIQEILKSTNIPIMDEEIVNARHIERQQWTSFWCIDPLDGTKEYIKRNGEFAVNIALVEGQKAIFGVIASPVNQNLIFGSKETGVFHASFEQFENDSWQMLTAKQKVNQPLVMVSSRSHHHGISLDFVNALKEQFGEVAFLQKGSALKFFDLALGNADVYPRFAPTMEWDIAAGQAILEALGGQIVQPNTGQSLVYNKENLLNPHFIAQTSSFLQVKGKFPHE